MPEAQTTAPPLLKTTVRLPGQTSTISVGIAMCGVQNMAASGIRINMLTGAPLLYKIVAVHHVAEHFNCAWSCSLYFCS